MKQKIAAIILKGSKILAVRKKDTDIYIMPGGGPEGNETHEETLTRELKEELNVKPHNVKFFGSFVEPAIFEDGNIEAHIYLADMEGKPKPQSEIIEYRWLDKNFKDEGIKCGSVLADRVIPKLIKMELM